MEVGVALDVYTKEHRVFALLRHIVLLGSSLCACVSIDHAANRLQLSLLGWFLLLLLSVLLRILHHSGWSLLDLYELLHDPGCLVLAIWELHQHFLVLPKLGQKCLIVLRVGFRADAGELREDLV